MALPLCGFARPRVHVPRDERLRGRCECPDAGCVLSTALRRIASSPRTQCTQPNPGFDANFTAAAVEFMSHAVALYGGDKSLPLFLALGPMSLCPRNATVAAVAALVTRGYNATFVDMSPGAPCVSGRVAWGLLFSHAPTLTHGYFLVARPSSRFAGRLLEPPRCRWTQGHV